MVAVMSLDATVHALQQGPLLPSAFEFIKPDRTRSGRGTQVEVEGVAKVKLAADDLSVQEVKIIVADRSPLVVVKNLGLAQEKEINN